MTNENSYMDEQDFLEQRLDEQANERALASIEASPKWQEALKQRQARQARKQKGLRSRRKK